MGRRNPVARPRPRGDRRPRLSLRTRLRAARELGTEVAALPVPAAGSPRRRIAALDRRIARVLDAGGGMRLAPWDEAPEPADDEEDEDPASPPCFRSS